MALSDLKQLTKASLSLYNAGVVSLMYLTGCPSPSMLSTASIFSGACKIQLVLMASSTQAMNQVIEANQDRLMKRTENRPVASGRLTSFAGTCISGTLAAASLGIFSQFGYMTCITASSIWIGYITVYVPLKKVTRFNTHVGALVGAAPAYLGWVAATNTFVGLDPFLLALHLYSWQFPHVYGILWTYKNDFSNAGFKMITDMDSSGAKSYKSAVLGNLGQFVSAAGMVWTGTINPLLFVIGTGYCINSVIESLSQFKSFPNSLTGCKLMVSSYKTIGTMFIVMICSWIYKTLSTKLAYQIEQSKKDVRKYELYK